MNTEIKTVTCGTTGEKYFRFTHKSGVTVLIAPNGYSTSHAIFAAKYGSVDNTFTYDGKKYTVPAGIAHFLEHKLFETETGGDAFELFAQTGADANAFTSRSVTAYLFTSTENFYQSLEILLDFVSHPHFTDASVKKEQGIICQELAMYEDSPPSRCAKNLLRCLYKNHPVRDDIVGTRDSIQSITPEHLYLCHRAFYTMPNMVLSVSGNVDIERIIAVMDECLPVADKTAAKSVMPGERKYAYKKLSRCRMQVANPLFCFGIKDTDISSDPEERQKKSIALTVLADMLFGPSSVLYNKLYTDGLINGELSPGYSYSDSFANFTVSGESVKPFTVHRRLYECIERAISEGISQDDFEISKKITYAGFVRSLQDSESYAYEMLSSELDGVSLLGFTDAVKDITPQYALDVLGKLYDKRACAFSVIDRLQ